MNTQVCLVVKSLLKCEQVHVCFLYARCSASPDQWILNNLISWIFLFVSAHFDANVSIDVSLKLDGLALRWTLIFTWINDSLIILSTLDAHSIRSIVHLETTAVMFPLFGPLTLIIVEVCWALWLAYPRQFHLSILKNRAPRHNFRLISRATEPSMDRVSEVPTIIHILIDVIFRTPV